MHRYTETCANRFWNCTRVRFRGEIVGASKFLIAPYSVTTIITITINIS